jgi:hypothetical protein
MEGSWKIHPLQQVIAALLIASFASQICASDVVTFSLPPPAFSEIALDFHLFFFSILLFNKNNNSWSICQMN